MSTPSLTRTQRVTLHAIARTAAAVSRLAAQVWRPANRLAATLDDLAEDASLISHNARRLLDPPPPPAPAPTPTLRQPIDPDRDRR